MQCWKTQKTLNVSAKLEISEPYLGCELTRMSHIICDCIIIECYAREMMKRNNAAFGSIPPHDAPHGFFEHQCVEI